MTYPRSHLVDANGGVYHVCSRCVRRAFLCGTDHQSDFNFDHRRQWVEDRMLMLSEIFAIEIYGYAVMSNHYHIVLEVRLQDVDKWTDENLVDRWLLLNPRRNENADTRQALKMALLVAQIYRGLSSKPPPQRQSILPCSKKVLIRQSFLHHLL